MSKADYIKIGKVLTDATDGNHMTKLEKQNGKPLKRDPDNLKAKAASSFLMKHGEDFKQKIRKQGGLPAKA